MKNNEERLTIKKLNSGTLKRVLMALGRASTELISAGSFMGGAYTLIEGIKGNPLLGDTVALNYVYAVIGMALSYLSTTISYDLKEQMDEEEKENVKGIK